MEIPWGKKKSLATGNLNLCPESVEPLFVVCLTNLYILGIIFLGYKMLLQKKIFFHGHSVNRKETSFSMSIYRRQI